MAKKKIVARGRHLKLPIIGDTVSEMCFATSRLVCLIFRDTQDNESQLAIEVAITLSNNGENIVLPSSRPGTNFDPKKLYPLLNLLGSSVVVAWAERNGDLEIVFANGWILRVIPESGYEAWHFHYPRPGRSAGGNVKDCVSIHGYEGGVIT